MITNTLYLKVVVYIKFFWSSNFLLVGAWLVGGRLVSDWWSVVGWLVGRWSVIGGGLVGGFKETRIETSQLIFAADQLTRFYVRVTLAFNGLNKVQINKYMEDQQVCVCKVNAADPEELLISLDEHRDKLILSSLLRLAKNID